jgi:diaminohydroxyphosphoribosylaminopyrimidine deaminase/5-amino-6-(5-phosphoribosylamino)uracil reductase
MTDKINTQTYFNRKMMRNCLRLAKRGQGFVSPNPMVGATIVKNGRIIGEGWHEKFGEAHAEINAIRNATESVEGATLYVSLEPCSHQGKTPACSLAIIQSKFSRVFIATLDSNPLVSGRGAKMLRQAGIAVEIGLLEKEAQKLNEHFFHFIKTKRPFVALKTASSIDGKIATKRGESQWITNSYSRQYVHQLRRQYSAILVGINTVMTDNPKLTIRLRKTKVKQPLRIVLDSSLRIPLHSEILNNEVSNTWVACTSKASTQKIKQLENLGVKVIICPEENGQVDLHFLMERLGKANIDSLLVEGGGSVNFSFLKAQLVDKVYAFIAPILIGGTEAKTSLEGSGFAKLSEAISLNHMHYRRFKNDLLIEAYTSCLQD